MKKLITDEEMERISAELDRISDLADPYQQGYLSAPLIMQLSGCSIHVLMQTMRHDAEANPGDRERDRGALAWCQEQIDNAAPGDFLA